MDQHVAEQRHTRMPVIPALDGIRAIAVAAVLLYHADVLWIPGGLLGVEVFFVLSGYLITSLLWSEMRETGGLGFKDFWRRRARRLLPALFLMLIATAAAFVLGWPSEVAKLRGDIAAAFGYVSNWYLIGGDHSYFSSFGRPSPFRHLWSLAIEEQFYLLWPPVLLLFKRLLRYRILIAAAIGVGALTSAAFMWLLYGGDDPSRAYYGTDTRVAGLLIGAGLAVLWRPFARDARTPHVSASVLDGASVAAAAVLAWSFLRFDEFGAFTYRPGIQLVALATAVLIAAAVHPDARLARALGREPLRWLGQRSYAIYLWHWPVFVVTRPGLDLGWSSGPTLMLRVALTLGLAEVSYRWIEQPFRRGVVGQTVREVLARIVLSPTIRRRAVVGWTSIFTMLFVGMAALAGAVVRAPGPAPATLAGDGGIALVRPMTPDGLSSLDPTTTPSPKRRIKPATATSPRSSPSRAAAKTTPIPDVPVVKAEVVAIGDSVMLGARATLRARIDRVYVDAALSRQASSGIALLRKLRAADRLGEVVVIHLGNNGTFTREQFDEMMSVLSGVRRVLFVNVKVPRRWEGAVNSTIAAGVARYPEAGLVDWHARWKACPNRVFADDGVHLTAAGAACYAALIAAAI